MTKQSRKKKIPLKLWLSICMECKFDNLQRKLLICHYFSWKPYLKSSKKLYIKHATYDICDSFMDEKIDIWINLQVWNLTDATYVKLHNKTIP